MTNKCSSFEPFLIYETVVKRERRQTVKVLISILSIIIDFNKTGAYLESAYTSCHRYPANNSSRERNGQGRNSANWCRGNPNTPEAFLTSIISKLAPRPHLGFTGTDNTETAKLTAAFKCWARRYLHLPSGSNVAPSQIFTLYRQDKVGKRFVSGIYSQDRLLSFR
jgi:hypothetical protein